MLRIPWPFSDQTLLLSPRWGQLPAAGQGVALLVICLVPLLLVVWLYQTELRRVQRRVALLLLVLRLLVLAVVLFLLAFQPILARTTYEELPGRVLVAVDRSASMDVTDPQRPAADKLRLARALNEFAGLCTREQLDDWLRHYADGGDPPPLPAEQRPRHEELCQRIDGLTRGQVADKVLAPEGVGLLTALTRRHHVTLLNFAQEVWEVRLDDSGRPEDQAAPPANPGLQVTDLRAPLSRALEQAGPNQGKILGLVLLSDGQHNYGPSPVAKAHELGEQGLPVYPVALGSRTAPPDVALAAVKAPSAVFKDADAPVEARFKVSGLAAQELVVELQRPDGPPLEERLRHDGTDRYYTVRFQPRLSQVGTQTLTVHVRPAAGEGRGDNNTRPVVINVADDKAKVLVIEGEARWEFHYLASALQRDRTVELVSTVFAQPRLGRINEDELLASGNPRSNLPPEPDALASYDAIILGDVYPEQLPALERARLENYVTERGGTLVLLAGKRAMPLGLLGADEPLARLLPIENPRTVAPRHGFSVALTPEGKRTPFLQMASTPQDNDRRWAELPKHFWGVVGRAKPAATALARLADGDGAPSQRDQDNALIVRQNYGFGRVLYVGLDSTWRWRFKVGDTYHHRFWGQVVRWAASDKPLVAGNEHVRFGTREPVYRQGQEIEFIVRLADAVQPLTRNALAGARVLRQPGGAAAALVPLASREGQPRVLEGKLRDLPPGAYAVELAIPELADKLLTPQGPLRATFSVAPPDSDERVELATNWPLLEELAVKSGGKVFTPEDAAELTELLVKQSRTEAHYSEQRLWQWWGTLVLLLTLLTAEWGLRKWVGLP